MPNLLTWVALTSPINRVLQLLVDPSQLRGSEDPERERELSLREFFALKNFCINSL